MTEVARSATVAATAEHVWELLADFGEISAWASNVDHSCLMSDQTSGPGTVRRVQVGAATMVETVRRWEPQQLLSYDIDGLPPVIAAATNTWELQPAGSYTTVTLTSSIRSGPRPPQRVAGRVAARQMAKASDVMLDGLAARLQPGGRP